jgi:hypothetical protein
MCIAKSAPKPPAPPAIDQKILTGNTPSKEQLEAAQNNYWIDSSGERFLLDSSKNASWYPSTTRVHPTYIPQPPQYMFTASAPTDIGTGAQSIMAGAPLSPSLRQMIRNDIAGAVKDEFGQQKNKYQIQYLYQ